MQIIFSSSISLETVLDAVPYPSATIAINSYPFLINRISLISSPYLRKSLIQHG